VLRQLDFHGSELAVVDKELAIEALTDPVVARLMTIPGVDAIAGVAIVAAVGDFHRFPDAGRLVAYVGLNPKVRQSVTRHRCTVGSARPAGPRCAVCRSTVSRHFETCPKDVTSAPLAR
jgi:transposase